jgi:hypothetical protein
MIADLVTGDPPARSPAAGQKGTFPGRCPTLGLAIKADRG